MTVIFVALALLLITLVALLVLAFERKPQPPPRRDRPRSSIPPTPQTPRRRLSRAKKPRGSPTNPFGMPEPAGAMILSRRVLRDLPLPLPPPPPGSSEVDVEAQVKTLVATRDVTPTIIELEVDD